MAAMPLIVNFSTPMSVGEGGHSYPRRPANQTTQEDPARKLEPEIRGVEMKSESKTVDVDALRAKAFDMVIVNITETIHEGPGDLPEGVEAQHANVRASRAKRRRFTVDQESYSNHRGLLAYAEPASQHA
jgi:hypothetical protein